MFRRSTGTTTIIVESPAVDTSEEAGDNVGSARELLTSLAAAVGPTLSEARDKIGPIFEDALDKIAPVVEEARDKIGPAVDDARDKIAPVMSDARDKVGPLAGSALVAGRAHGRKAAIKLGLAEEPQPESHKLRNLLIVLGLGGAAAFAYQKITGKDADPAWTASRDSAAASHANYGSQPVESSNESDTVETTSHLAAVDAPPLSTDAPDDQSDTAPSAPFPSEETVESSVPTTPDQPLERKNL